mmetsp:Transcript_67797/g.113861  ORF Transcript_67797/g.113861 Transcript_67797/m.113861 type:complete len:113 (+) Transcript_67797:252-590(+)
MIRLRGGFWLGGGGLQRLNLCTVHGQHTVCPPKMALPHNSWSTGARCQVRWMGGQVAVLAHKSPSSPAPHGAEVAWASASGAAKRVNAPRASHFPSCFPLPAYGTVRICLSP